MKSQGPFLQFIAPILMTLVLSACGAAPETSPTMQIQETPLTIFTEEAPSANESNAIEWVGHTREGDDFAFAIEGSDITSVTAGYQIEGCGALTTVMGTLGSVTPDGFEITIESLNSGAGPNSQYTAIITITGQFNSESSASGTMTVSGTPCGDLHTEWEAGVGQAPAAGQSQETSPTVQTEETPLATPTQEMSSEYKPNTGPWIGQTQEGNRFEFTIEGLDIASLTMDYQVDGCAATINLVDNLGPIISNEFEINTQTSDFGAGPDPQFAAVVIVLGQFSSESSALGDIIIIGGLCGDFYTEWEASQG